MRHLPLNLFALCAACLAPFALPAAMDTLAVDAPRALSVTGVELSMGCQIYERGLWFGEDSGGRLSDESLKWIDNGVMVHGVDLAGTLRWQATDRLGLQAALPWSFIEMGAGQSNLVNDEGVRRGDHSGDASAACRLWLGAVGSERRNAQAGLALGVAAPTGLSPWQARHPWLATGTGGWAFTAGVNASQRVGGVELGESAAGAFNLGHEATLPAEVSPTAGAAYPAGPAFVRPGAALKLGVSLMALLARDGRATYQVGGDLRWAFQREYEVGGRAVPGTNTKAVELYPQFKAVFGGDFTFVLGARYPLVLVHQVGPNSFEPMLRVDVGL